MARLSLSHLQRCITSVHHTRTDHRRHHMHCKRVSSGRHKELVLLDQAELSEGLGLLANFLLVILPGILAMEEQS